jgi:hypothetical protein
MRPPGVWCQVYSGWTGVQLALKFDRFDFSDESLVVVGQERTDHVEHGVTEATISPRILFGATHQVPSTIRPR